MMIRGENNKTRNTVLPMVVIFFCVLLFSFWYIQTRVGNSERGHNVPENEVLTAAVASFYADSVNDEETALKIKSAIAIYTEYGEDSGIATDSIESLSRYMGHLRFRAGDWAEALSWYKRAMLLNETSNKKSRQKRLMRVDYQYYNAISFYRLGILDSADYYYRKEVAELVKLDKHHIYLSGVYNNLGLIYSLKEDYITSLIYYLKSLSELDHNYLDTNMADFAMCLNNIGMVFFELESFEIGLQFFRLALDLYTSEKKTINIADQYQNIALSFVKMHEKDSVKIYFGKALENYHLDESKFETSSIQVYLNYGNLLLTNSDDSDTLSGIINHLEGVYKSKIVIPHIQRIQIGYFLSDYYYQNSRIERSLIYLYDAIHDNLKKPKKDFNDNNFDDCFIPTLMIYSLIRKGNIEYMNIESEGYIKCLNTYAAVQKVILRSLSDIEDSKSQILLKEELYNYYKNFTSILIEYIRICPESDRLQSVDQLLTLSELCKFDILRNSIKENSGKSGVDNSFIVNNILMYRDSFHFNTLKGLLGLINMDYINCKNIICSDNSKMNDYLLFPSIDLANLMNQLNNNDLLVNTILSSDSVYFFLVKNNSYCLLPIGDLAEIEKSIHKANGSIRKYEPPDVLFENLFNLSKHILSPLKDYLECVNHIIFIPEGYISEIPFECLLFKSNDINQYLIERYRVSNFLSLSLLPANLSHRQDTIFDFYGFAPWAKIRGSNKNDILDLPYSGYEIYRIDSLLESHGVSTTSFYGKNAKSTDFLKSLQKKSIVHLSSHSSINRSDSDFSCLQFSLSDKSPKLYLWSLSAYEFNADILVLSSCQSGAGKIYYMEGIDSFVSAFYSSGIDDIIYTRWNLPDYFACLFFPVFYEDFYQSNSISQSLMTTKRYFIQNTDYSHPFFWASIKAIGI